MSAAQKRNHDGDRKKQLEIIESIPATVRSAVQEIKPAENKPDPAIAYDTVFFDREEKFNRAREKGVPAANLETQNLKLETPDEVVSDIKFEINKLILATDFIKNDANLAATDIRKVKDIKSVVGNGTENLMLSFSSPEFENAREVSGGLIYVDDKRANILVADSLTEDIPALELNEAVYRPMMVALRQDIPPAQAINQSSAAAGRHNRDLEIGAARMDFNTMELESIFNNKTSSLYLVRGGTIINCSNTKQNISGPIKAVSGKISLTEKNIIVVLSEQLKTVLYDLNQFEKNLPDTSLEEVVSMELMSAIRLSTNSEGIINSEKVSEIIINKVNKYLVLNKKPALSPSVMMLVQVPSKE